MARRRWRFAGHLKQRDYWQETSSKTRSLQIFGINATILSSKAKKPYKILPSSHFHHHIDHNISPLHKQFSFCWPSAVRHKAIRHGPQGVALGCLLPCEIERHPTGAAPAMAWLDWSPRAPQSPATITGCAILGPPEDMAFTIRRRSPRGNLAAISDPFARWKRGERRGWKRE